MFVPTRLTSLPPALTVMRAFAGNVAPGATTSVPFVTTMSSISTGPASVTVPAPTFLSVPDEP